MQEVVVGFEATKPGVGRACFGQGFLLDSQVGVEIDLGGLDRLVTQPQPCCEFIAVDRVE